MRKATSRTNSTPKHLQTPSNFKHSSFAPQQCSQINDMEHVIHITTALLQQGFPKPKPQWLTNLLQTQRASTPLPALLATVKHRLLACNFATDNVLIPNTPCFPPACSSPNTKEMTIMGPMPVQVVGIEDISKSRWEQIEAIEAQERGETTRGREVIRVVADEEGETGQGQAAAAAGPRANNGNNAGRGGSYGSHKLVLQDVKGQTVYAFELTKIPKIEVGMNIGTKMMLRNVLIARGLVMLEPEKLVVLGGKVDVLHKEWVENRKKGLLEAVGAAP